MARASPGNIKNVLRRKRQGEANELVTAVLYEREREREKYTRAHAYSR
jgi:hypothetical protein